MEPKEPKAIQADTSRILMSDALQGQLADLTDEAYDSLAGAGVYVIVDRRVGGQQLPLAGVLRSVLFDVTPELEMRVQLEEALAVVQATDLTIGEVELQHGEKTTVKMPGPFTIKAARIEDIDVPGQLCVLLLQLHRVKKA